MEHIFSLKDNVWPKLKTNVQKHWQSFSAEIGAQMTNVKRPGCVTDFMNVYGYVQ